MCLLVLIIVVFFFFKQKTAYEMRISDWSSDVCSSDLASLPERSGELSGGAGRPAKPLRGRAGAGRKPPRTARQPRLALCGAGRRPQSLNRAACSARSRAFRSEEHTSEIQSLMRISYAVFCLKKKQPIIAYKTSKTISKLV